MLLEAAIVGIKDQPKISKRPKVNSLKYEVHTEEE